MLLKHRHTVIEETPTHLTCSHRGRLRTVDKQVLIWRKRKARYNRLRGAVLDLLLAAKGNDTQAAAEWLKTPAEGLRGRAPKSLMNPDSILVLHRYTRKVFSKQP